jgi:hypothetical protein
VITGLLSGIAASPWARTALRYDVIVLAILLFLLALRRSGERAGGHGCAAGDHGENA